MTLRQYLILMSTGTAICWLTWILIVFGVSPQGLGAVSLIFFYTSFFLALVGTFSVAGFLIQRQLLKNDDLVFRKVKRTFRQGILSSSLVIAVLILLHARLLTWWLAILIALLYAVLEGLMLTRYKTSNDEYV